MNEGLQILNQTPIGPVFSLLFGLIWGSFFNVCICRIPAEESVVKHRSRCPKCAAPIFWYHNIPVLSWVALRGKCRSCREPISIQYPLVELATALLYLFLFLRFGLGIQWIAYALFLSYLLVISVIDLYHRIIPDELSLSGIVVGFLAALATGDITWLESLLGILVGGGVFLAIAWSYEKLSGREGLGGGDIKLLAMLGAWLGVKSILLIIVISSALGSVVGILFMLGKKKDMKTAIPFGPFLAFAAAVYLFWGSQIQSVLFPEVP